MASPRPRQVLLLMIFTVTSSSKLVSRDLATNMRRGHQAGIRGPSGPGGEITAESDEASMSCATRR